MPLLRREHLALRNNASLALYNTITQYYRELLYLMGWRLLCQHVFIDNKMASATTATGARTRISTRKK